MPGEASGWSSAWADYDGDGLNDVYVVNNGAGANVLLRNNGDGTFTDVTSAAGVGDTCCGLSGAWADYDGDGLDDVYVVCQPVRVRAVIDLLRQALSLLAGIELHLGKTKVWNHAGHRPPGPRPPACKARERR